MNVIGLFQTVNKTTKEREWSMTRVQMAIMTLFNVAFLWWFYIVDANAVNMENIALTVVLLLTAVTPKALKDFSVEKVS